MKKVVISIFFLFLLLLTISVILLSTIGYETKRFNNIISEKIEENNQDISIKLNKIKFKLDIKKFSLFIETQKPLLNYKDIEIPIKNTKVYLDFLSLIKSKSKINKIEIVSKEINIEQLKRIIIKTKPSNFNSLILNKVNSGSLTTNLELYFKENLILENFIARGNVKKMKANIFKNFNLQNTQFNFFFDNTYVLIKDIQSEVNGIILNEGSLKIKKDQNITIESDFITKLNINKNNINSYLQLFKNFKFFNKETILDTKLNHNLTVTLDSTYKVVDYTYSNRGNIKYFSNKLNKKIESEFLNDDLEILSLKDSEINFNNSFKQKHNLVLKGKYSLQDDTYSNYELKSDFLKDNLNVDLKLDFPQELKLELINYKKQKKIDAKIVINLNKKKDELNFKKIKISENKNFIDINNLKIKNNALASLEEIKVKTYVENSLSNDFAINFGKTIIIKGNKFDAQNLNKFFSQKSNNNVFKNISKNIDIRFKNISTPLSKKMSNFRLIGEIKNGEFIKISSKGDFEQDKFLDITLKSDKNNKKKYLEIYSDLPQPLLSEYSFFNGLSGGTLMFTSIIEGELSNSKLVIENFKIINAPGVVKLLSLADFGGLADLAEGEGLSFEKLEIQMSKKEELLKLEELFAIGPSISVLMEGYKDKNNLTSLRGTLVPAKNLNKLLSKIPVIREIIIPKEIGEGLFGVSFKMKGMPGEIKTTINPIKTLTPRFITKALKKSQKSK